jgi:DNA-binding response OmpR family regulator
MENKDNILIVEDEADINALIAYNLQKEGHTVVRVFDGNVATQRLAKEYFNIVILDIMLPGINGFEICKKIKDKADSQRTFVIVVSAKSSTQDKLYAHIMGADCYLCKPFKVETLLNVVKEVSELRSKNYSVNGL